MGPRPKVGVWLKSRVTRLFRRIFGFSLFRIVRTKKPGVRRAEKKHEAYGKVDSAWPGGEKSAGTLRFAPRPGRFFPTRPGRVDLSISFVFFSPCERPPRRGLGPRGPLGPHGMPLWEFVKPQGSPGPQGAPKNPSARARARARAREIAKKNARFFFAKK